MMFNTPRPAFTVSLRRVALAAAIILLAAACGRPSYKSTLLKYFFPAIAQAQTSPQSINLDWATIEQNLITEHNRIRQNPQSYIPVLEAYLATMTAEGEIPNGCGQGCTLVTEEGRRAVEEAINFLRTQPAVAPLEPSAEIASIAKAHAQEQSGGAVGHVSADGRRVVQRLSSLGLQATSVGESIDYGSTDAQSVIVSLIVDDGVADRGHRTSLFSPEWTTAGVGCGPHATIRTVCVVDYASISRQLTVVNNGTVDLRSLKVGDVDILGGALAPGNTRQITIADNHSCNVTLSLQTGNNASLDWRDLMLCGATLTVDSQNAFSIRY
ncbi:MAG: CAP domain-containing protein [Cyanobacteria bacterium J06555_13]